MLMTALTVWDVAAADGQTIIHHLKSEGWSQSDIAVEIGTTKSAISKAATGHDKNGCSAENTRRLQKLWCSTHGLPEPDVDPRPLPDWLLSGMWRYARDMRTRLLTETPRMQRRTGGWDSLRPSVAPVAEATGLPLPRVELIMGASHQVKGRTPLVTPQEIDLICCRLKILNVEAYGVPA